MTQQQTQPQGVVTQSLIRKLTTEKAVKAHRQQSSEKDSAASEEDITNIKLSSRGIKTIESLDLPSLRYWVDCNIFYIVSCTLLSRFSKTRTSKLPPPSAPVFPHVHPPVSLAPLAPFPASFESLVVR